MHKILFVPYKRLWRVFCCCLIAQLCTTVWDPMDCSIPGFTVFHYFLEFAQTHVLWISDAIQPSHPLVGMIFVFKCDCAPPTVLWLLLCSWTWGIFLWWIATFSCDSCSAASCDFGVLAGEDEHTSFYSAVLFLPLCSGLLWLASFTSHYVFKVPCCSIHQHLTPLHCQVIFLWMDTPCCIYPLIWVASSLVLL